ncbi:ATP-binding protein [Streptomyces sp. NBC_00424]|uniref:ATP-binding protein n=1 Tax=unclassified Streptomyces TaxID=2593676 RepID=UPI002B1E4CBD|nr:ATP-binding protein [Streptomyces sp. NBC_00424]
MTWKRAGKHDRPAARQPPANDKAEGTELRTAPGSDAFSLSAEFEGLEPIAHARELTRRFLTDLHHVHGLPVSDQAQDLVELVVSELLTNTRKYAPGPSLLTLQVRDQCVDVAVWDSTRTRRPSCLPTPPGSGSTAWKSSSPQH